MNPTRNTICLRAYTEGGQQLLDQSLSLSRFYEESHPVLDEPEYRRERRIVCLRGVIYDADGAVSQEVEACFDASGLCVSETVRFSGGSVLETRQHVRNLHEQGGATRR